jgi:hypothetical protein
MLRNEINDLVAVVEANFYVPSDGSFQMAQDEKCGNL